MSEQKLLNKDLMRGASEFHFRRFMESGKEEHLNAYKSTRAKYDSMKPVIRFDEVNPFKQGFSAWFKGVR